MAFEREADFATGSVDGASFELRPDAVVPLVMPSPGPVSLGNVSQGLLVKGWYVRQDNVTGRVFLGESDTGGWKPETVIYSYAGDPVDMLSLAFDAAGLPVLAMERGGNIYVRYHDGVSYTIVDLGVGSSPALIHRAPDTPFREIVLFYEKDSSIRYRIASDDYDTEYDTETGLGTDQKIWRAILGQENRLHLILSTRNPTEGTYSLQRVSEENPFTAGCIEADGYSERIEDGSITLLVFRGDGEVRTTCDVECDILLIGAGGDAGGNIGGSGRAEDTIFWSSLDGLGLDPDTDPPVDEHRALGGGHGGPDDRGGGSGGSGGGGGGKSPSGNTMWSTGGLGTSPQGKNGGGGQSTWGLAWYIAASGGGGGYGGPGISGGALAGAHNPGYGGPGAKIPGWNWSGPGGGKGYLQDNGTDGPTGAVLGGGGAGGVRTVTGLLLQAGQTFPVHVGSGLGGASAGRGGPSFGNSGLGGWAGMVVLRVRTADLAPIPSAVLSGGTETFWGGYRYHKFTADGTITVVTPGKVEALLCGGGGGGGSGCGGGGGGGDVRYVEGQLTADQTITVGAGGDGGTAGSAGEDGEDSSIGRIAVAKGGGGGAGDGTAAGSRASGGGGHGTDGSGGDGLAMRGWPGGDGKGFSLSAGGSAKSAGGGGGAGTEGKIGAEQETQGDELAVNWDVPTSYVVNIAEQYGDQQTNQDRALLNKNVSRGECFVQARVRMGHNDAQVGIAARASHPLGVDDVPDGYWLWLNRGVLQARLYRDSTELQRVSAFGAVLAEWHQLQLYVADNVQQGFYKTADGSSGRLSAADGTHNGDDTRSAGVRAFGGTNGAGRRSQDDLMIFASKNLEVGNMPTGGKIQVWHDGVMLVEETESSGTAVADLSQFGDGSLGIGLFIPTGGLDELRVVSSVGATIATKAGGVFPGGEYDVNGSALDVRIDSSGAEPVPITGLLAWTQFDELTPGPEHGDGGDGILVDDFGLDWRGVDPDVGDDDGYLGGGGGGGAELFIAGLGGRGGAGDGGVDVTPPTAGEVNTGGGGGGSGDSSVDGAAGGSGVIILRAFVDQPADAVLTEVGMVTNHDAQLITGLIDQDPVVVWEDAGPNDIDLNGVGGPLYRDGIGESIRGFPCVRTTTNKYLQYAAAIMNGETEGEVFAVMAVDAENVQNGAWHFSASNFSAHHPYQDGVIYEAWGRNARVTAGNPAVDLTQPHLYHVRSIAGEYTIRINGVNFYTTASNTTAFLTTAPLIGKSKDAYYFIGLWGHIVTYNRPLLVSERTGIEKYLDWRWSLDLGL